MLTRDNIGEIIDPLRERLAALQDESRETTHQATENERDLEDIFGRLTLLEDRIEQIWEWVQDAP